MEQPLVTILIPVYNREKYIEKALQSAIEQSYQNIEIIVVDNHSTDTTWEILEQWQQKDFRIHCYRNEKNIGPVLNWKKGLELAKGKYVKILWSDDWMAPQFIEEAIKIFDDQTAFVLAPVQIVNNLMETVGTMSFSSPTYSTEEFLDNVLFRRNIPFPVSPGAALFRLEDIRNSFITEIPNDDNLDSKKNGAGNDLLFYLITANKYTTIKVLPFYGNYFRYHTESFSVENNLEIYYEWARLFFIRNFQYKINRLSWLKAYYFILLHIRSRADYKTIYSNLHYTLVGIGWVVYYTSIIYFSKIKRLILFSK